MRFVYPNEIHFQETTQTSTYSSLYLANLEIRLPSSSARPSKCLQHSRVKNAAVGARQVVEESEMAGVLRIRKFGGKTAQLLE